MKSKQENIDALRECLEEVGIELTSEQAETVCVAFEWHLDMMRDMEMSSVARYIPECQKCKRLESDLKDMTRERDVYHNSVCARRNTKDVWISGNDVRFNP